MSDDVDIHALEIDFSKHPNTDAFVRLCEAYLGQKRYMEAMLVCKKGIKNLPNDPRGRLLLARVYLEQGKQPKAEQELQTLLEVFPDNLDAMILQADLYKKSGRKSEAIVALQKVFAVSPGRADIREQLKALGVDAEAPRAPQRAAGGPPPHPGAMPPQYAGGPPPRGAGGPPPGPPRLPPQQAPSGVANAFGQDMAAGFQNPGYPAGYPQAQGGGRRSVQNVFEGDHAAEDFEPPRGRRQTTNTFTGPHHKPRGNPRTTIAIVLVLVFGLGGAMVYMVLHAATVRKIDQLVREAKPNFERNTFVGLKLAADRYLKILDEDPKNTVALSALAYIHYWLWGEQLVKDSKPLAEKYLELANQGSAKDENQYRVSARAMAKLYNNDAKGAADELQAQINKGFLSPLVMLVLADAYAAQGREAETRDALTRASNISASDNMVLTRIGQGNLDDAKYEAAKGYFDQVLNQEGGHPGAIIGRIYANLGKKNDAVDAADKDLEKLSSTPAEYLTPRWQAGMIWARGLVELRRGQAPAAKKSFEESAAIAPPLMRQLELRAKIYTTQDMYADAAKDYQTVLAKRPNHRPAQMAMAMVLAALGKPNDAMGLVDQLLQKDPNDVDLLSVKARALRAQNKIDEAIATYQKVFAAAPKNVDAKLELAALYRDKRDYVHARDLLIATAKESKGRGLAMVITELGRLYQEQGNFELARSSFMEAVNADKTFPDPYYFLGKMLKGKPQKEAMQQYLARAPSGPFSADAERLLRMP